MTELTPEENAAQYRWADGFLKAEMANAAKAPAEAYAASWGKALATLRAVLRARFDNQLSEAGDGAP